MTDPTLNPTLDLSSVFAAAQAAAEGQARAFSDAVLAGHQAGWEAAAQEAARLAAQLQAEIDRLRALVPPEVTIWELPTPPLGAITPAWWSEATGVPVGKISQASLSRMVGEDTVNGRVLRHLIPADTVGLPTGLTFPFSVPLENAVVSLRVCLTPSTSPWPWSPLGFKLPGIVATSPGTPLDYPSGGTYPGDRGAAVRIMVRQDGKMLSYAYGPEQAKRPGVVNADGTIGVQGQNCYGDDLWWAQGRKGLAGADQVLDLTQEHTLNTPTRVDAGTDGRLVASLAGQTQLEQPYVYRTSPDVALRGMQWSVFAGGTDKRWKAPVARCVDVVAAKVTTHTTVRAS